MTRKIAARKSPIHGNGVFALQPIARGERIIEYKGKRRTHAEVDADDSGDVESGHTFLFTLDDDWVIDANHGGNSARWINFSCNPNCEAVLQEDEKDPRKGDITIQDPAVEATVTGTADLPLGEEVSVELVSADPRTRDVEFRLA